MEALVIGLVGLAALAAGVWWRSRSAALATARLADLAEMDRLRGALAAAEQRTAQVEGALHGTELGVLVTDGAGRVRLANPVAHRFLDARHGEAVAEVRITEVLAEVLREGRPLSRELDLYTPVRRALRLRAAPLDEGAVLYIEDLTEGRRLDEVRRDFVANASHELKTPLGALSVLAETLATSLDDPQLTVRLAQRVAEEARRLGRLVEELLDLSRIEAEAVRFEPVAVAAVVEDALERLPAQGVDVLVDAVPDGLVVLGDRRQLTSALFNLLDNAIKYSPPGAKVCLRVMERDQRAVVEVEDQGTGVPASQLERIFERFYRLERASAGEGTGLGLAIVKHVAINHGGSVQVDSEEGRGSRFWLDLPIHRA
ncbi:MAG: sensor histidine kinase [Acidimicrobiia bacterium]